MRRNSLRRWISALASLALVMALVIEPIRWNPDMQSYSSSSPDFSAKPTSWPNASSSPGFLPDNAPELLAANAAGIPSDEAETVVSQVSLEPIPYAPAQSVAELIVKNPDREVHIASTVKAKPAPTVYEVTAFFLNVRANAYPGSKVIDVVKKGTKLEVLSETDNGWLRIKGGGYVHGDYAEPAQRIGEEAALAPSAYAKNAEGQEETYESEEAISFPEAEQPVKPSSAVEADSGLTAEDIAVIFDGTALSGHGLEEAILEVEEKYGINALFTIAVMKLESGNGKSRLARNKNNLFGLNATGADPHGKAFSFETKGESVIKFGQLLADKYVDKGYTTIEKIAKKYCPANSKWSGLVKNIMNRDYKKLT